MKYEHPLRRPSQIIEGIPPRSPRRTTANRAARRERESPIGLPLRRPSETARHAPEAPATQPQTARHGGSVEGSRGAHADGGTRHRASSRRLHRTISPWRGAGSRGATVGRPSAHCASPGRHSEPRPRQPHRPSACAASPSSKAPTVWATAPPAWGRANRGDPRTRSPPMGAQTA